VVSTHWEHHALIVGIVAIVVVMFAPRGIVGLWNEWLGRLTDRGNNGTREPATEAGL
jgi:branched-chain amino acid transport system permease protein